jgi:hypothetical protein
MQQQTRTAQRVRLNESAYEQARTWIAQGKAVLDDRDAWSEHQPSSRKKNDFIRDHGWGAYARCYLGINEDAVEETRERYEFPYRDFEKVHRCGVLAAESRGGPRQARRHRDRGRAPARDARKVDGTGRPRPWPRPTAVAAPDLRAPSGRQPWS